MAYRVALQPAYVLHLKPYRDTSALVEVLTPEHGRVGLVARGIRAAASKLRSVVQPFSPLLVSWSGRGELPSLTGAESQGKAMVFQPEALACALYMNELIMRLTHRAEPQIELFSVYDVSLRQLCSSANSSSGNSSSQPDSPPHSEPVRLHLQQVLRRFEIDLLHSLGYGLVLDEVAGKGEKVRGDLIYDFQLETGPVVFVEPDQETFGVKISGKTLLALANNRLEENSAELDIYREAKQLLRFVLDRYLGNKPLVSRQLLRRKSIVPNSSNGITPLE